MFGYSKGEKIIFVFVFLFLFEIQPQVFGCNKAIIN